jgi:hypothetical protein
MGVYSILEAINLKITMCMCASDNIFRQSKQFSDIFDSKESQKSESIKLSKSNSNKQYSKGSTEAKIFEGSLNKKIDKRLLHNRVQSISNNTTQFLLKSSDQDEIKSPSEVGSQVNFQIFKF